MRHTAITALPSFLKSSVQTRRWFSRWTRAPKIASHPLKRSASTAKKTRALTNQHTVTSHIYYISLSRSQTAARTSRAAGCWPGVGDEAGWGWWWPRARERTGNGGEAFTDVGLDSTERRSEAEGKSKPNVFFIMIDDMGWNDIGYQSTDLHAVTPNLNRMAAAGMRVSLCDRAEDALYRGRWRTNIATDFLAKFSPDIPEARTPWFRLFGVHRRLLCFPGDCLIIWSVQ